MYNRTDIPIHPSPWVGLLAALPWFALAVFNLILANAYSFAFALLPPLALAGGVWQWKLTGRLSLRRSIVRLVITNDGLQAQQQNGDCYPVTVAANSRLSPRLAILKLQPTAATYRSFSVLLWSDNQGDRFLRGNVPADLLRQLRVWLRLGPTSSPDQSP